MINLLKTILEPLSYVYNTNVIHRDFKPENLIFRDNDHQIVIIDFGVIKQKLATQFSNTQIGISPTINKTVAIGT